MDKLTGQVRKKIFEEQIGSTSRKDFAHRNHCFFALINFNENGDQEYHLSAFDVLETGDPLLTKEIGNQLNIRIDPATGEILLVFEVDKTEKVSFLFSKHNSPEERKAAIDLTDRAFEEFSRAKQYSPTRGGDGRIRGSGFLFG